MTLAQIAEKPITVTTEEAISNFADSRQGRLPVFVLAVFAKNEKANVSAAERNALAKMVADMIESYRRQK